MALAAFMIPKKKMDPKEILIIALTAAASFAVLDFFSPGIAQGARQGTGFGIGFGMLGGGAHGAGNMAPANMGQFQSGGASHDDEVMNGQEGEVVPPAGQMQDGSLTDEDMDETTPEGFEGFKGSI